MIDVVSAGHAGDPRDPRIWLLAGGGGGRCRLMEVDDPMVDDALQVSALYHVDALERRIVELEREVMRDRGS